MLRRHAPSRAPRPPATHLPPPRARAGRPGTTTGLSALGCAALLATAPSPARASGPAGPAPRFDVESYAVVGDTARYVLRLPATSTGVHLTEADVERAVRACLDAHADTPSVRACDLRARVPGVTAAVPLPALVPAPPPVPKRPWERADSAAPDGPPPPRPGALAAARGVRALTRGTPDDSAVDGALTGKTVYVSAGHGWTWEAGPRAWVTQRGATHGLVEDLSNAESVDVYLLPLLRNAGANVVPVREEERGAFGAVVDDSGGEGEYSEEGPASAFDDGGAGYAPPTGAYRNGENPFAAGTTRTLRTRPGGGGARAVWAPLVPTTGRHGVYVSYARATGEARYEIRHASGATEVVVDQSRHAGTWVRLGDFWFEAGLDAEHAAVVLHDDGPSGGEVSIDAVRLGGGDGDVDRGGGTSGRPRWEEAARYQAQRNGAPTTVYDAADTDHDDDVGARSRFADWHHEDGEDAIYLAWHSNAPDPGRGTSTFVYGPNPPDGTYDFTGVEGSDRLGRLVHEEVVGDLQAAFDPAWRDRGVYSAWFGELNPRHNDETPATLIEVAFHDTAADAEKMKEPRWRRIVARAVVQGIVRYFAERDRRTPTLPPEPPERVRAWGADGDTVMVTWTASAADNGDDVAAGDAADAYIVEVSHGAGAGGDWRVGAEATRAPAALSGFSPGEPVFVRVRGRNAGGVSEPGEVVGASAGAGRGPRVLVVHAFDRLDAALAPRENLASRGLGPVVRVLPERMNPRDAAVRHGLALSARGIAWDATSNEPVGAATVRLPGYAAVDWIAGRESTRDETFSGPEQAAVRQYVEAGGALVVSGTEIAWDLGNRGAATDQAFLHEVLGALYAEDDSGTRHAEGTRAGALSGLSVDFDDPDAYDVEYPDVFTATRDGEGVFEYGAGALAAIATPHSVLFGFPLETVRGADTRAELLGRALEAVAGDLSRAPPDDGEADAGGGGPDEPPPGEPPDDVPDGGFGDDDPPDAGEAPGPDDHGPPVGSGARDGGRGDGGRDAGRRDGGGTDPELDDGGGDDSGGGCAGCVVGRGPAAGLDGLVAGALLAGAWRATRRRRMRARS